MSYIIRSRCLIAAGVILLACSGCQRKELEPTPPEPARPAPILRSELQFRSVKASGEAVQEASLTTHLLPQMHSRLDIRTMSVAAGKPTTIPINNEAILEVRAGSLSTIVDGKPQRLERGDIWQAAKDSRITVQAFGELAVVRVIYLLPGEK